MIISEILDENLIIEMKEDYIDRILSDLSYDQIKDYARRYIEIDLSDLNQDGMDFNEDKILEEINGSNHKDEIFSSYLNEDQIQEINEFYELDS